MQDQRRPPATAAARFAERRIAIARNRRGEVAAIRPDRVLVEADRDGEQELEELLRERDGAVPRGEPQPAATRISDRLLKVNVETERSAGAGPPSPDAVMRTVEYL